MNIMLNLSCDILITQKLFIFPILFEHSATSMDRIKN